MQISISCSSLKWDVDIETRKAGFFQVNKDAPEERNESQMGQEESDLHYFEQWAQTAVDELVAVLHRFATSTATSYDQPTTKKGKKWVVELSDNITGSPKEVISDSLNRLSHQFVLLSVLHAWAVMTMPSLAEQYAARKNATALEIKQFVYRKHTPQL